MNQGGIGAGNAFVEYTTPSDPHHPEAPCNTEEDIDHLHLQRR